MSTVHRALRRRGLVEDQPHKRPHSSLVRFEWPNPNDLWQIDATRWVLATGKESWIMDVLDDHSRLVPTARAHARATTEAALDAFTHAVSRCGLPARMLSDNGLCFATGKTAPSGFTAALDSLGVRHIRSSPYHPQTCGKLERFHQTLKRWLRTKPLAASLEELQGQLDDFLDFYNTRRPHRALGGATPRERYDAGTPAVSVPVGTGEQAVEIRRLRTDPDGKVRWEPYVILIGRHAASLPVTVIKRGLSMWVFGPDALLRRLVIDPDRRYQGNGGKRGRPSKLRHAYHCR